MTKWLAAVGALLLAMACVQAAVAGQPGAIRPVHT
jgi:hypothetical protein